MKSYLVDVNVWVALAYSQHVHHELVTRWFDTLAAGNAFFCRLSQLGFLRLLTNRVVMGTDTVSQREAWDIYDQLLRDFRVSFIPEPESIEPVFRSLTRGSQAANRVWTDAYLAALASTAGLTIATLDQRFSASGNGHVLLLA